jgi:hypothetical protein
MFPQSRLAVANSTIRYSRGIEGLDYIATRSIKSKVASSPGCMCFITMLKDVDNLVVFVWAKS